ncbi:MAG: class I SAM-dependent methyltransferase [Betaproteobacteria bacterium]|nr:class I SAM-dependent methyltransferase [Betaproteobacteria bacterium]
MAVLSADQAFRRAYDRYRAGRVGEAEELCRAALKAEPGHADSAYLLALIAARSGRHAEADGLLARAVEHQAFSITLDYPVPSAPRHSAAPHARLYALLERGVADYRGLLQSFAPFVPALGAIPAAADGSDAPHWNNAWIPGFDGIALYCLTALKRPRRYIEVGSGISTRFVRRAIRDHDLATIIVSIDPEPRAEVDALCDEVIRAPLERSDLALFDGLTAGDLLFVDSSHRCFTGSDVTVFFTEVLPALAPGITVGVHDVFLPFDYPAEWVPRYYSEQYLLACYLLAGGARFRARLPVHFALAHADCRDAVEALTPVLPAGAPHGGTSFWLETAARA